MELIFDKQHRYRLSDDNKIGTNNSTIYKAQDLDYNRTVCIKVVQLDNSRSKNSAEYKRAVLELKTIVSVSELTTHVPVIYNSFFEESTSRLYIIMQWINGLTLEEKISNTNPLQFLGYIKNLCDVLEKLEHLKLSHKDIKPSNIIITPDNDLFLIDFNLTISTPNQVEGTRYYKAPEMDSNSVSISRSNVDIFSIGVILYQYFTGTIPTRGTEYAILSRRNKGHSPEWDTFIEPTTYNPGITPSINNIIVKCMKLNPKQRYNSSRELKRAIISAEKELRNGNKGKRAKEKV